MESNLQGLHYIASVEFLSLRTEPSGASDKSSITDEETKARKWQPEFYPASWRLKLDLTNTSIFS